MAGGVCEGEVVGSAGDGTGCGVGVFDCGVVTGKKRKRKM